MYLNLLLRSADEGLTWSAPVVVPDYGWSGVECAGLTDLGRGRVMLNQWRFRLATRCPPPGAGPTGPASPFRPISRAGSQARPSSISIRPWRSSRSA